MPRWEDERYVRLYTRDTVTWKLLPWQSKCVLPLLLRKVDRAGVAELGDVDPTEAVAALIEIPTDVVGPGLAALMLRGTVVIHCDGRLVFPKFLEAQEARQSDAARKRASRERARLGTDKPVTECDQHGRGGDASSHDVTPGHTGSLRAVPSRAVPDPEHTPPARAREDSGGAPGEELPGQRIASELRRHPALVADLDVRKLAEVLFGRMTSAGKALDWVLAAIAEAAADTVPGETAETRWKRVRVYVDHAKAARSGPGPPGHKRNPRTGAPEQSGANPNEWVDMSSTR